MELFKALSHYNFITLFGIVPGLYAIMTAARGFVVVSGIVTGFYMALFLPFRVYPCNYTPNTLKPVKKPCRHLKRAYIDGVTTRAKQQQHNYAIISRRCNIVPLFDHISKICCFL